ncbi:MAG: IS1595 family transposase [Parvularcula sp.]|nr:IS1595 family transposase [Parvularcula sp.]
MSLSSVLSMSEKRAYAKFKRIVWGANDGKPVCPACGGLDHWDLVEDKKWKCRGCRKQFTVTSDTIFASHKLSFRKMLAACAIFANGAMGVAACRLSREIQVSYKTAFVLLHKVREAMGQDGDASPLGGVVEIDGSVFGGSMPKFPNNKELWAEFHKKHKAAARKKIKLIVVLREREHQEADRIARIRTFLVEKEGDAVEIARRLVDPKATIQADMNNEFDLLHLYFDTKRINHSECFSKDGACTNMAESFFGRMWAAEAGVYRHISGNHVHRYAQELGWREQYRRKPNGDLFNFMIAAIGRAGPSQTMRGYWQRRKANDDGPGSNDNAPGAEVVDLLTGRKGSSSGAR